jgi:ABC-2 type transport system permease protein
MTVDNDVRRGGREPAATPSWQLVAERELTVKLHDKTFLWSTGFMLLIIVASIAVSAFLSNRTQERTIGVVDGAGARIVAAAADRAREDSQLRLTTERAGSRAAVRRLLADGTVDVALLPVAGTGDGPRWEVLGQKDVDGDLRDRLADAVAGSELAANARDVGSSSDVILAGTTLRERVVDDSGLESGLRYGLGFAFSFLFYVTALVFGLSIAQGVIEEKQSRVVEILAAAIPIRALLTGKVVGNSVLAIGQVVLLSGVGLIGMALSDQGDLLAPVLGAGAWFVVFFLLGFVALACVWAVAGSVATRAEDLQATTTPVQAVVLVALFVGISGSGKVLTVGSFVPLVSSAAMPVRLLQGGVPLWQPVVSALIVLAAAVLLVRLGARLYEGSLLRTDRRTTLREALAGSREG